MPSHYIASAIDTAYIKRAADDLNLYPTVPDIDLPVNRTYIIHQHHLLGCAVQNLYGWKYGAVYSHRLVRQKHGNRGGCDRAPQTRV